MWVRIPAGYEIFQYVKPNRKEVNTDFQKKTRQGTFVLGHGKVSCIPGDLKRQPEKMIGSNNSDFLKIFGRLILTIFLVSIIIYGHSSYTNFSTTQDWMFFRYTAT